MFKTSLLRTVALGCLVLVLGCSTEQRASNRYDFQPGRIARKYTQVALVRPPLILRRPMWTDVAPRGRFRSLQHPRRVVVFCACDYQRGSNAALGYLEQHQAAVWQEHGWGEVPGHYYVRDPAQIIEGRDLSMAPVSEYALDLERSIAIYVMGSFADSPPDFETVSILADLLAHLCDRFKIDPEAIYLASSLDAEAPPIGQYMDTWFTKGWMAKEVTRRIELAYNTEPLK